MPDIIELAEAAESRNAIIVTSTITLLEVTSCIDDKDLEDRFQRSFNASHHSLYGAELKVMTKARRLRADLHKAEPAFKISVPDAIHVATAMILGVDEIHTFDGGKVDKDKCSLLNLSGHPLLDKLVIKKPEAPKPVEPEADPNQAVLPGLEKL
ncbi:PIN domain-containing protein [Luteolibacter sp. GHJ8]|uniref:PIN domain-containing protein n=1 Tax=Luteolibacter rhizosphaerae TaxID=2989719 RepID=A0ABT3G8P8_9BACT|nr:PIN domain-containing protein [Luteolibacter rhizosphaerae]MCW1915839.1 PIN domain-containing protein [Luteolibacter rhizosphaerae]